MLSLQQAVTLHAERCGGADAEDDVNGLVGPTIIRVFRRVSSRQIRARRRRGIPHPGEVRHRSQGSGGAFVELSRTPAMRIVTAVTRPTIVASPG